MHGRVSAPPLRKDVFVVGGAGKEPPPSLTRHRSATLRQAQSQIARKRGRIKCTGGSQPLPYEKAWLWLVARTRCISSLQNHGKRKSEVQKQKRLRFSRSLFVPKNYSLLITPIWAELSIRLRDLGGQDCPDYLPVGVQQSSRRIADRCCRVYRHAAPRRFGCQRAAALG